MKVAPALACTFALVVGATAACSTTAPAPIESTPNDNTGSFGLALTSASGVALDLVTFTVNGPLGFNRVGSVNLAGQTTVSALVGGIVAGSGYTITVTARTSGGLPCLGSAMGVTVLANATTAVAVHLQCTPIHSTGSVLISGDVNVCPLIDSTSAAPLVSPVGGTIALSATATDVDNSPAPLSYVWSATSGTLSNATTSSPTLTCTSPGTSTVRVTVSDGDTCPDTATFAVTCIGAGAADAEAEAIAIHEPAEGGDASDAELREGTDGHDADQQEDAGD